jgi:hypothetical protein
MKNLFVKRKRSLASKYGKISELLQKAMNKSLKIRENNAEGTANRTNQTEKNCKAKGLSL